MSIPGRASGRPRGRTTAETLTLPQAQRAFEREKSGKDAPSGSAAWERYIVALDNLITAEKKHG